MTDNRTTEQTAMERFRAELEKRGIEFETDDDECAEGEERTTTFKANLGEGDSDIFVTAKDWYFDGKLMPWLEVEFHNVLTPEQAIAATLGSGTCEQVREAIEEAEAELLESCEYVGTMGERKGDVIEAFDKLKQAIADELNAVLGGSECEFIPFKDEDWSEPNAVRGVCSECSALMYGKDNYCPNCGARVRKKVDE